MAFIVTIIIAASFFFGGKIVARITNLVHRLQYLAFISRYWNMQFSDIVDATLRGMAKVSFGEIFDDFDKEKSYEKSLSTPDDEIPL